MLVSRLNSGAQKMGLDLRTAQLGWATTSQPQWPTQSIAELTDELCQGGPLRTQRTTTVAERRLTCAGGEAKQQKAPSRPARGASACQRGQTPLRARERRSRMSCPCLSAHMPRHSHSMAQVDRGVKVMKVCGQLIPGRVLGIALVALAFSRLASGAFRKQMPS